ncbi:MAG TPA: beta-propeller domain-containing protein [Firmicutes bacterium]|nr:beta-propeller domain-containing protein [Bacillota bacterium]
MFEEEYRQEMQKTAPSDFARDALLKEMDTLRYRPKRPPVRAIAAVLTALVLLSALALPAVLQMRSADGYETLLEKLQGMDDYCSYEAYVLHSLSNDTAILEQPEEPGVYLEYSETNNQVAGVQEPDAVKTDGRYIYTASDSNSLVYITRADNGSLSAAATLDLTADSAVCAGVRRQSGGRMSPGSICGLLLGGSRLTVLMDVPSQRVLSALSAGSTYVYGRSTLAMVYDVSDPAAPAFVNEFLLSGTCKTARQIDGHVYIQTRERAYRSDDVYDILPSCTAGHTTAYPKSEDILISDDANMPYFTSICVLDTSGNARCTGIRTFLGYSGPLYMNAENLYMTRAGFSDADNTTFTEFVKLTRCGDGLEPVAKGRVPGELLNQFSMDEYGGVLRVAVMEYGDRDIFNSLYTLRQDGDRLVIAGTLIGLGLTESIYGVRFCGDVGYIVTFRQTDPLYTVDLSDPAQPKLCSELKITGYSSYLHAYGEGKLFGFGNEATEEGLVHSLKLSMFDISHLNAVRTENARAFDDLSPLYSYTHRMLLVDPVKNLIGFPAEQRDGTGVYLLFSYDESEGFVERARIPLSAFPSINARGLYIGDCYYIVSQSGITPLSLTDFQIHGPFSFK